MTAMREDPLGIPEEMMAQVNQEKVVGKSKVGTKKKASSHGDVVVQKRKSSRISEQYKQTTSQSGPKVVLTLQDDDEDFVAIPEPTTQESVAKGKGCADEEFPTQSSTIHAGTCTPFGHVLEKGHYKKGGVHYVTTDVLKEAALKKIGDRKKKAQEKCKKKAKK